MEILRFTLILSQVVLARHFRLHMLDKKGKMTLDSSVTAQGVTIAPGTLRYIDTVPI
jgi:hypothetical protein